MNNLVSKYLFFYPIFFFRKQYLWSKINKFKKTQFLDLEETKIIQWKKFKQIISFAYENIEFYKEKFNKSSIHPDDIMSIDDIEKIPILTKQDIVNNKGKIYNIKYSGKRYRRATSGSSGNPLVFYKDTKSMEVMDAILYRNYSWFGIDIGDRQARFWGHPLNNFQNMKTRWSDMILNRIRLSPFQLQDEAYEIYLKEIKGFKAHYIYGYAQSIFQFSQYFFNKNIDLSYLKLKAVILTGEMVFPEQINIIKNVFGCDVTEDYGCTEVGVIGFKCKYGQMHLMENLLVEEIHSTDNNIGDIIVSELYGELFPFIRYQVGDKGTIKVEKCLCKKNMPVLSNLAGRIDDFIKCPNGKLIDPYCLEYIINQMSGKFGRIFQFRIVQESLKRLDIFFVANGNFNKIENYIMQEFNKTLSSDIKLNIKFVNLIEKELSGKQRCFISKIS